MFSIVGVTIDIIHAEGVPLGKMIAFLTMRVACLTCPRARTPQLHLRPLRLFPLFWGKPWVIFAEQPRVTSRERRSAIHRTPAGAHGQSAAKMVRHQYSDDGPACFPMLVATRRISLRRCRSVRQPEGGTVDQKQPPQQPPPACAGSIRFVKIWSQTGSTASSGNRFRARLSAPVLLETRFSTTRSPCTNCCTASARLPGRPSAATS